MRETKELIEQKDSKTLEPNPSSYTSISQRH